METSLYQITFNDGRIFKIFCANKRQKQRLHYLFYGIKEVANCKVLENGIHNIKQFEDILK